MGKKYTHTKNTNKHQSGVEMLIVWKIWHSGKVGDNSKRIWKCQRVPREEMGGKVRLSILLVQAPAVYLSGRAGTKVMYLP